MAEDGLVKIYHNVHKIKHIIDNDGNYKMQKINVPITEYMNRDALDTKLINVLYGHEERDWKNICYMSFKEFVDYFTEKVKPYAPEIKVELITDNIQEVIPEDAREENIQYDFEIDHDYTEDGVKYALEQIFERDATEDEVKFAWDALKDEMPHVTAVVAECIRNNMHIFYREDDNDVSDNN